MSKKTDKEIRRREFPGSPVVRTRCFHCQGPGSIPGQGTKILQAAAVWPDKINKEEKKKKFEDYTHGHIC